MKMDRISFEILFPTGLYANQRFTIEGSLEPGESIQEAFKQAKHELEKSFHYINPQLITSPLNPDQPLPVVSVTKEEVGDLASQMKSCKEKKTLETYKLLIKGKPDLEKIYNEMWSKLNK